jgi:hypothetical protein
MREIALQRNGIAQRVNIPAPYGGLNTRDSESNMQPTDAIVLENFIPEQGAVKSRKGFIEYCTGLGGYVETLIEHYSQANRKFLACHNGKITNITDPTSVVELGNGYNNNKWEHVAFNGYTLLVNGQDSPIKYDGSTITSNAINPSGGTASSLDGINIFKSTVFVWDTEKPFFWYGAVNAISGTFSKFDLSYICPNGGNVLRMIFETFKYLSSGIFSLLIDKNFSNNFEPSDMDFEIILADEYYSNPEISKIIK